ncbi:TatD DNase family protein [Ceratobasidium sp. AG-Ba]|nr:TatD DNase family protein [Ceratobasidium sp. AG-Ba]QRW12022.1 TatD DNase family protein [Ceratobasidium sp. AG-Ba]
MDVLNRAKNAGVESAVLTGGSLHESSEALELAEQLGFFATVGCHPTRSSQCVAVGECGLDYDRLHFSSAETQRRHFRSQLALAKKYHLPLFLHVRAAHEDFVNILREEGFGEDGGRAVGGRGGVVHSFTGRTKEMKEFVAMGFHVSVNGCSMKTDQNLATTKAIPFTHLMVETDAPWCTMTSTHSSRAHLNSLPSNLRELYFPPTCQPEKFIEGRAVKGRNEPCAVGGVAWVVASLNNCELDDVSRATWNNSVEMFNLHELMDEQYHKDIAARDAAKASVSAPVAKTQATPAPAAAELDPTEKKIKGLQKKLQAIQQLKERRDKGDKLELTQLQKIEGEADLLKQLEDAKANQDSTK